jgi:histidyl-tRNA synthetase
MKKVNSQPFRGMRDLLPDELKRHDETNSGYHKVFSEFWFFSNQNTSY